MDATSITTSTFTLRDPASNLVSATVTYSSSSKTATLQPSAALAPATTYTATVAGGTGGVRSSAAVPMAANFSWSFTIVAPPTVTSVSPAAGATGVQSTAAVTATFDQAMDATSVTTSTFTLRDPANNLVSATLTYTVSSRTASLRPSATLAPATTYTATVAGGTGGVRSSVGVPMAANYSWSFTTAQYLTIWPNTAAPAVAAANDGAAVELGVKFTSDQAGYIKGIRFYKSSTNTGTHTGSLWSSTGQRLATATFSSETAAGWQQVLFSQPVAISANTVYVASYHTATGHYADDETYFANAGYDNPPLHALKNGVSGANGVYRYGGSAFPNQTFNSTNYWVDVVFSTTP